MALMYGFGFNGFCQLSKHSSCGHSQKCVTPIQLNILCDQLLCSEKSDLTIPQSCSTSADTPARKKLKSTLPTSYDRVQHQEISIGWDRISITQHGGVSLIVCDQKKKMEHLQGQSVFNYEDSVLSVTHGWTTSFAVTTDGCGYACNHEDRDNQKWSKIVLQGLEESHALAAIKTGGTHMIGITDELSIGSIHEDKDNSSYVYRSLNLAVKVKKVSLGKEHVLVLSQIGIVFSYGIGGQGQLGHGTIENEDEPKVISYLEGCSITDIAAGGWHSVCVSDIGDVYTWGWNERGQLGKPSKKVQERIENNATRIDSDKAYSASSRTVKDISERDDLINMLTYPDLLDFVTLDESEVVIDQVSCGSRHTAALSSCSTLFTWGWNDYGQLGHGDLDSRDCPTTVNYFEDLEGFKLSSVECGFWSTVVSGSRSNLDSPQL